MLYDLEGLAERLLPAVAADDRGFALRRGGLQALDLSPSRSTRFQRIHRGAGTTPPSFNGSDALELVPCP